MNDATIDWEKLAKHVSQHILFLQIIWEGTSSPLLTSESAATIRDELRDEIALLLKFCEHIQAHVQAIKTVAERGKEKSL